MQILLSPWERKKRNSIDSVLCIIGIRMQRTDACSRVRDVCIQFSVVIYWLLTSMSVCDGFVSISLSFFFLKRIGWRVSAVNAATNDCLNCANFQMMIHTFTSFFIFTKHDEFTESSYSEPRVYKTIFFQTAAEMFVCDLDISEIYVRSFLCVKIN